MDCGLAVSRICTACEHFNADGTLARCPECDGEMRLTFLGPPGRVENQPRTVDRAAWQKEFARRSRPAEQSGRSRLAQISMGVGFQFVILRVGTLVVGFSHADAIMTMDFGLLPFYLAFLMIGIFVLSALVAGAIAGAWCVNWVLQGIAVGLGYSALVLIRLLLLLPFDMVANLEIPLGFLVPMLAVTLVSTALSVAGAFIGHLLIQPLRLSIEGDGY